MVGKCVKFATRQIRWVTESEFVVLVNDKLRPSPTEGAHMNHHPISIRRRQKREGMKERKKERYNKLNYN